MNHGNAHREEAPGGSDGVEPCRPLVMKFGGTSIGGPSRILAVAEIVRARLAQRPVVVVSALGGVTDLLEAAIERARADDLEGLEPLLADLERRHRWAREGTVEAAEPSHRLRLSVDRLFDELRERLRSIRVLGEVTPRAADSILAMGERLSATIVVAAFRECGLPARAIDAREVIATDERHGAATPSLEEVRRRGARAVLPVASRGELAVLEGFIGSSPSGETTTLGRGGSDTSAAVLGSALDAPEIQIWTDVDGLMTADPRLVPAAVPLERVSFAEAAELAFHGAKVLHPASIEPAVRQAIPVRVLNSMRPAGHGTVIVGEVEDVPGRPLASVASRRGVALVRSRRATRTAGAEILAALLEAARGERIVPDLVVAGDAGAVVAVRGAASADALARRLDPGVGIEVLPDRALVCLVGAGLARHGEVRARAIEALSRWEPEVVAVGASGTSVLAALSPDRLEAAVRALHRSFFEGEVAA